MGTYYTNPVRHPEDVGVGHIRRRVVYNQSGLSAGVAIGALEKGSIPLRASAYVYTAFNAGTTNTLVLGDKTTDNSVMTTANTGSTSTGNKQGSGVALGKALDADTVFYAKFTQSGTAASAGDVEFVIEFVNPRQWVDDQGNQTVPGQVA